MSAHELALQKALIAHLRGDAAVTALLATPPTTAEAPIPSPNVLPFRPRRIVAFIEEHRAMAAEIGRAHV